MKPSGLLLKRPVFLGWGLFTLIVLFTVVLRVCADTEEGGVHFQQKFQSLEDGQAQVSFMPTQPVLSAKVHYRSDHLGQLIQKLENKNGAWEAILDHLPLNEVVDYSFSYRLPDSSQHTSWFRATYGDPNGTSVPIPSENLPPVGGGTSSGNTLPLLPPHQPPRIGKYFDRILTIVLENTNFDDAIQDSYLGELAKAGVLFTQFQAITHPSYPNYLAMVAGDTFGVKDDDQVNLNVTSIADLIEAKDLSWSSYAEKYPNHCFLGDRSGTYARKHEPFLSFQPIQKDPSRCAKVVSEEQFSVDWSKRVMANYSLYVPDLNNDGHDTGVSAAAAWLKKFLNPLLSDPVGMTGTLIQITFDENGGKPGNIIYNLFIGPMVKAGYKVESSYNFYDVLKMVEDNFDLGNLGRGDAKAKAMDPAIWVH